jgi:hypothetical protein
MSGLAVSDTEKSNRGEKDAMEGFDTAGVGTTALDGNGLVTSTRDDRRSLTV